MQTVDLLISLRESVSEETYEEIIRLVEGSLFGADKRGDLFDDISRALTGKSIGDHLRHGVQKLVKNAGDKVKDKINKSKIVQSTIGKREYDNASKDLDRAELNYRYAKDAQKYSSDDPAKQRVYKEDAKRYDKEANKHAKKVSDIKKKYGFN